MNQTIWYSDRCLVCEHPVFARSAEALNAAVRDHVDFIAAVTDKTTDPHFEQARLTHLVEN